MKGEYLSIETAQKLARYEKAIKFINKRLDNKNIPKQIKGHYKFVLDILEVKK